MKQITKQSDFQKPKTLHELEAINREEVERLWLFYFKSKLPKGLSVALAKPILAHEFQARRHGALDRLSKAALKQQAAPTAKSKTKLQIGSQLIREWNGVTHKVEVVEGGYAWQGRPYRSLSAIAEAITGAHWSGPRFFGLKRSPKSGNRFSEQAARQINIGQGHG